MQIKKWINRQLGIISLALSNVEKNALSQTSDTLGNDATHTKRLTFGKVSDALINGEITQEVIDLRWRTYKILKASEGITTEIIGYDKDGLPITKTKKSSKTKTLSKIKLDTFDSYPLEMVIDNHEIAIGTNEVLSNEKIEIVSGETETHGVISGYNYFASNKSEKPIKILREEAPNFEIETYTTQLKIRKIDEEKRLLEFYVSSYPDEYNRTSRLFLKNISKAIKNPMSNSMLDIKIVEFITYKNLGVNDFLYFNYEINNFDKIIEYNGFFVIKFIATVTINGDDIFEKYKSEGLDKKYENKTKK